MVQVVDATQGFTDEDSIDLDEIDNYIAKQQEEMSAADPKGKKKYSKSNFFDDEVESEISDKTKDSKKGAAKSKGKKGKKSKSENIDKETGFDLPDLRNVGTNDSSDNGEEIANNVQISPQKSRPKRKNSALQSEPKMQKKITKAKKAASRPKVKISQVLQDQVDKILFKMNEAYNSDIHSVASGKPGVKKLALLPEINLILNKSSGHGYLAHNQMFYDTISKWLTVNSETKKLQNASIRSTLIGVINNFTKKIPVEYLKINDLGKSLKIMSKHPEESKANKEILLKLLDNWYSEIFQIPTNYSATVENYIESSSEEEESGDAGGGGLFKKTVLMSSYAHSNQASDPAVEENPDKIYPRAKMPETSKKYYKVMPRNDVLEYEISRASFDEIEQRRGTMKKLRNMKSIITGAK